MQSRDEKELSKYEKKRAQKVTPKIYRKNTKSQQNKRKNIGISVLTNLQNAQQKGFKKFKKCVTPTPKMGKTYFGKSKERVSQSYIKKNTPNPKFRKNRDNVIDFSKKDLASQKKIYSYANLNRNKTPKSNPKSNLGNQKSKKLDKHKRSRTPYEISTKKSRSSRNNDLKSQQYSKIHSSNKSLSNRFFFKKKTESSFTIKNSEKLDQEDKVKIGSFDSFNNELEKNQLKELYQLIKPNNTSHNLDYFSFLKEWITRNILKQAKFEKFKNENQEKIKRLDSEIVNLYKENKNISIINIKIQNEYDQLKKKHSQYTSRIENFQRKKFDFEKHQIEQKFIEAIEDFKDEKYFENVVNLSKLLLSFQEFEINRRNFEDTFESKIKTGSDNRDQKNQMFFRNKTEEQPPLQLEELVFENSDRFLMSHKQIYKGVRHAKRHLSHITKANCKVEYIKLLEETNRYLASELDMWLKIFHKKQSLEIESSLESNNLSFQR